MAERERCQEPEPEITSEDNPIDEDELELSLGLRPIHPRPRLIFTSHNFPEFSASSSPVPNSSPSPSLSSSPPISFSKHEVQAFRRREAKKKRDLKRKASITRFPWLQSVEGRERNCDDSPPAEDGGQCCKVQKLNPSYWAAGGVGVGGFRPYQVKECENRQSISTGSSSGISDNYQSISGPGGTSSDVGSHSSHPHSQPSLPSFPTAVTPEADFRANGSTPTQAQRPKLCKSSSHQMGSVMSPRQPLVEDGSFYDKGCIPTSQTSGPKVETRKPPKPKGPTNQQTLTLAQMHCVSVKGNGPNGKTITGLLYKYTQAEVSILCVCHRVSFSPAGFVEHAGGVDVEHPLKHIKVVPCGIS